VPTTVCSRVTIPQTNMTVLKIWLIATQSLLMHSIVAMTRGADIMPGNVAR